MTRVLVTGADGFVGRHLCRDLIASGHKVVGSVRVERSTQNSCALIPVGDIGDRTDWEQALAGVSTVVHLAARVHVMRETASDPEKAFRDVNLHGTINLARQAALKGVEQFIYLSTVKVNGERTFTTPFTANDAPLPEDAYAQSKWEAEQALWKIAEKTEMDIIVIRPPLIYGAGAKGNLLRLMALINKGIPLPFAAIRNKRSLLNVHNLTHFINICLGHPVASGQTYMISDSMDLSTPELVSKLAKAMACRPKLFSLPVNLLRLAGALTGRAAIVDRLCGNLQVDIAKNHDLLDWSPPFGVDEGLSEMARWVNQ